MKRLHFFRDCLVAVPLLAACAQHSGAGVPDALSPPHLDPSSRPPPQEIVPPRAIALDDVVRPVEAAEFAGRWRHAGCQLDLSGEGLEGAADVSGRCPETLRPVSGWQLEAVDRARLSLVDAAGEEVWAGLYMRDGRLSGFTAEGTPLEFLR